MRSNFLLSACIVVLTLLGGCSREDGVDVDTSVTVDEPDRFAQFFNPIAGLQAGDYTIVAATFNPGVAGDFTLTVTYDDGEVQTFTGSWTSSGGQDETSPDNPSFDITLYKAGGINIRLESATVDTYVYLLFAANGAVVAFNDDISVSDTNSLITKDASRIDSEEYAIAYYAAIDPDNVKTTLEEWKVVNGYYVAEAAGTVINARFRDTKDLGYGRGIRMWTTADGSVYFFAENFQVAVIPGQEYSTLNLEALITDDRQYHFGTNAIEFSTYPYGTGEPSDMASTYKFAKFYSFDASGADQTTGTQDHANETRLNQVNLDGRGDKSMPGACVYCHGGTLKPLLADDKFRDNSKDGTTGNGIKGDVNAKLQLMEVNSFEFWSESPYTQTEQEVFIKQINQTIYCTYPNPVDVVTPGYCPVQPDPAPAGAWAGDFAREMTEGWYDDPAVAGLFDNATFIGDFVPVGWQPNIATGNPPAGADQLFLKAIGPNCFICHSRRGVDIAAGDSENEHIDFSSYDKFIGDAELIKEYVFDKGMMPLSLRGYLDFWDEDNEAPVIMASFLNGVLAADNQISLNSSGRVDQPGVPLADAGPDRTTSSPTRLFGANSRFVDTYSWSIVSTPGGVSTLTDETTTSPLLTAAVDGDYIIQLTASNSTLSSSVVDTDTVTIKISSVLGVADPKNLVFADVEAILTPNCAFCHMNSGGGGVAGIPVWWVADGNQPAGGTTWYEEVLARVDFNEPAKSLILTKPSNTHHFGGLRTGFEIDNPANRANYDTILNWILEGAREN